jgi:signal transduction histidine kinase
MTRLRRRLMAPFALFTLGVGALFALFAFMFVYTVEDRLLERTLADEAQRQATHRAQSGSWTAPTAPGVSLHLDAAGLPPDLARVLADEPLRREAPGDDGRHYHLRALLEPGQPPWLVAEVSRQLVVRPMRDRLLRWFALWGAAATTLALALAWWLSRRISGPLERLAREVSGGSPQRLPERLAEADRDDEIGDVARHFESLLARTRAFIAREQAFTRDVSHELRTPLAVLGMAIERLLAEPAHDATTRQALESMRAAAAQMHQAVDTLLLLAREPTADAVASPVPLLPLVEAWVLAHADWIDRRGMALDVALSRADALSLPAAVLQRAVAILLENAFTHGRGGGIVRVAFVDGTLVVENAADAPSPADLAGPREGLGLGQDILRRLLERHGARFTFIQRDGLAQASLWK